MSRVLDGGAGVHSVGRPYIPLRFGFPLGTLRNWEQGIRTPQGPARTLLVVIDAEPEAVQRALGKAA
jgi:DNA-binding transcriptional regulator YiaG